MCMYIAFAVFTAFISTVEYGKMFFFQVWRAFYRHSTAYIVIRLFYFHVGKAKLMQQTEIRCIVLFWFKAETLHALFAQCICIEHKAYLKCAFYSGVQLLQFFRDKS